MRIVGFLRRVQRHSEDELRQLFIEFLCLLDLTDCPFMSTFISIFIRSLKSAPEISEKDLVPCAIYIYIHLYGHLLSQLWLPRHRSKFLESHKQQVELLRHSRGSAAWPKLKMLS